MLPKPDDSIRFYLSQLDKYPLLSREEEKELANKMRSKQTINLMIERKKRVGLTNDEIESFLRNHGLELLIKEGGDAFDKLVNSNLKLVVSIAKRFMGRSQHLKLLDLIQEGNIGLIKAIKRFKPKKGFRLSTYATHWIRQALDRAVTDNKDDIRLPIHTSLDLQNLKKTHRKLSSELKREPTKEEISREIKLSGNAKDRVSRVDSLELLSTRYFDSLYAPLPGGDSFLIDFIEDDSIRGPFQLCEKELIRRQIEEAVNNSLGDKEIEIINLRFGFNEDQDEKSLEEIGKIFGVTRERIRQIEATALKKLYKRLKNLALH